MMSRCKGLLVLLVVALALTACAKKQTTPIEEPPPPSPAVEQPVTPPPAPPPAVEKEPVALEDIYFDFDRFNIKDEYKSVMSRNAEILMSNPDARLLVEGHCDERGTNEYNMALGEKRAKAAVDFYTSYGVPANRITWISYGEEKPFDSGHDEAAWAKNRRAHMVIK